MAPSRGASAPVTAGPPAMGHPVSRAVGTGSASGSQVRGSGSVAVGLVHPRTVSPAQHLVAVDHAGAGRSRTARGPRCRRPRGVRPGPGGARRPSSRPAPGACASADPAGSGRARRRPRRSRSAPRPRSPAWTARRDRRRNARTSTTGSTGRACPDRAQSMPKSSSPAAATAASIRPSPSTSATSRTRRSSRLAMRGCPVSDVRSRRAPAVSMSAPRITAARSTMERRSSGS